MTVSLLRSGSFALPVALVAGLSVMPALADTASAPAPTGKDITASASAKPGVQEIAVPDAVRATVDKLTGGKAKILKAFKAPAGLIGVGISLGPNSNLVLYASADGKYLMQGVIMDSNGQNVTRVESKSVLPQPPSAAENFSTLDKTHSFVWGKADAPKELWLLFDPNCIYCHKTYDALKPAVEAGKVKVHVIQAGFLKSSSKAKAAAIMAAKDPAAALATDENKFDEAKEEGGIKGDTSDSKAVAAVEANNAWMEKQAISGTPYLLFKDASGKAVDIKGYDPDIKSLLARIGTAG